MLSVDQQGFDHLDRRLLLAMIEKFDGGPVGVDSLAAAISEERGTIEDVLEPYLIQQGFMLRTPRGRMVTRNAYLHFGLPPPAAPAPTVIPLDLDEEGDCYRDAGEFSLELRVYIEDTDAGGIVYYVNYLKFMERARTEFMRCLGYGKDYIFNHDLMFVVRDVAVKYLLPASLDDELVATAGYPRMRGASMVLHQRVRRGDECWRRAR